MAELLVVYWEGLEGGPQAGARFWSAHNITNDGRLRDWPKHGLKALGAAKVTVSEGEGLDLIPLSAAP